MEQENMTIFYRKKDLSIDAICQGEQTLAFYGEFAEEDIAMIMGYIYVPDNFFILRNKNGFYLEEDSTGNITLKIKEEFKQNIAQFL